jgi:hypothetical protein
MSSKSTARATPAWRRRYPSDMAVTRQSRRGPSVTKNMLKIKGLRREPEEVPAEIRFGAHERPAPLRYDCPSRRFIKGLGHENTPNCNLSSPWCIRLSVVEQIVSRRVTARSCADRYVSRPDVSRPDVSRPVLGNRRNGSQRLQAGVACGRQRNTLLPTHHIAHGGDRWKGRVSPW